MFELGKKGTPGRGPEGESGDREREEGRPSAASSPPRTVSSSGSVRDAAVIGPSIHIDGDLRGEEDLLIEGEVNGTVQLKSNSLTIGAKGKVRADVYAHSVFVEGLMEGDLFGSERVAILKTAEVRGNITAPRVSLEEGARFKGSIEMDTEVVKSTLGASQGTAGGQPTGGQPKGGATAARPSGSAGTSFKSDSATPDAAAKTGAAG